MSLWDYIQALLPACVTFGPAFLVMPGKDEKRTRLLRSVGAVMVAAALVIVWFITNGQKNEISLLQLRVEQLEAKGR